MNAHMSTGVPIIILHGSQPIKVHGWMAPKRTLTWDDVCSSNGFITVRKLADAGIPQRDLKRIQPDPVEWITHASATLKDVPLMTEWPLCPITHFKGDLSTLIEQRYSPQTLRAVGITYDIMRTKMFMTDEAMTFMGFDLRGWSHLGFSQESLRHMNDASIKKVFRNDRGSVSMSLGGIESGCK